MAEVVTSSAASQLSLLAYRQQDFFAERTSAPDLSAAAAPQKAPVILSPADVAGQKSPDGQSNQADQGGGRTRDRQGRQVLAAGTGPSKPRVELKRIDFGLTPAEVVGTPDVLQRFDNNRDGRIDLLESNKVQLSRHDGLTFKGLAAPAAKHDTPQSFAPAAPNNAGPQPQPVPANPDQHVTVKRFYVSPGRPDGQDAGVAVSKKFFGAEETASQGSPTDSVDAPRKFYGQGAEVVIGQFTTPADNAPKYYDKAPDARAVGAVVEDGTGEVKYYDRVAQTEADQQAFGDTPGGGGSYYDKARAVATNPKGGTPDVGPKKYVHAEVSVYAATANITADTPAVEVPASTVVTA